MATRKYLKFLLLFSSLLLVGLAFWRLIPPTHHPGSFDGQRAYKDVLTQVAFGPRVPGSQAHTSTISYIQEELLTAGWKARIQDTTWNGYHVQNIIASRSDQTPKILLGAHYDSRIVADQDPEPGNNAPVLGANDGASGVAVLLELARSLPSETIPTWLVFFDAEDNGGLDGRAWIMGSRAFVATSDLHPQAVVIIDMIGDADLNLYIERNSDITLVDEIWGQAARLGYEQQFIQTAKYSMLDDHTPFLEAGIPALDIIDFDYPYWHTTSDTADKVSPKSLQVVGETLRTWIMAKK
jgi:glutaminyl-peptide cyclotransferase